MACVQEPVLVEVVRSGMVESRHRGSVVGLDADGAVVLPVGDVDAPVYGRSANKPLQATAMVELGLDLPPRGWPWCPRATTASRRTSPESAAILAGPASTRAF